jgi:hypothetical protein
MRNRNLAYCAIIIYSFRAALVSLKPKITLFENRQVITEFNDKFDADCI